jgi:hypothetical protein
VLGALMILRQLGVLRRGEHTGLHNPICQPLSVCAAPPLIPARGAPRVLRATAVVFAGDFFRPSGN